MNEKLQESAQYLKCCSNIELEAFKLYETFAKKINQPESSFVLGLGYDSLKCAKIIHGLLSHLDGSDLINAASKKNLTELATETSTLSRKILKINNLNYQVSVEILKELVQMEDLLSDVYASYLQSSIPKMIADENSGVVFVNSASLKKILETFLEQKAKHRDLLFEIKYCIEAKQADLIRQVTPIVQYQNPDAWIRDSTLHAFTSTPAKTSTEL